MTILLIGGTGKTGIQIARRLQDAEVPVLLTSRSGSVPSPFRGVRFNWFDRTTYENAFEVVDDIDRVYIVGPPTQDALPVAKELIQIAIRKGVKRLVLLSAAVIPKGAPGVGQIHEYIAGLGLEYCVLQPSWFIENFGQLYLYSIRERHEIPTFTGEGRVPFVSVQDIADVAFYALTTESIKKSERIIVGPELYSNTEVAALLTGILGRRINHRHVSEDESKIFWASFGLAKEDVDALIKMEKFIADGNEEAFFYREDRVVGKTHLRDYFLTNRNIWLKEESD